jgi:hypothetical protein
LRAYSLSSLPSSPASPSTPVCRTMHIKTHTRLGASSAADGAR